MNGSHLAITSINKPSLQITLSQDPELKYSHEPVLDVPQPLNQTNRYLFTCPMSKRGKPLLRNIMKKFGSQFDYMIFVYDNEAFNEPEFDNCVKFYEKRLKWDYLKRLIRPQDIAGYDYIFCWDDDVTIDNFNVTNFIDIMRRNRIEVAQGALTHDSHFSWKITLKHPDYKIGRFTNFVEVMSPVFSRDAWIKFWDILEWDFNHWGWGYDMLAKQLCGFKRMAIIDQECISHTSPVQSGNTVAPLDMMKFLIQHDTTNIQLVIYDGQLQ